MKNFILGILVTMALILVAVGAFQFNQQNKINTPPIVNPAITQAVTQTVTPSVSDEQLLRQALFTKNNWPEDPSINVKINTNDGIYASGSVGGQGGGGYFFAAKVNGIWQIVADGNGTVQCSQLVPFPDFPNSLIPECWDESTDKLIKR